MEEKQHKGGCQIVVGGILALLVAGLGGYIWGYFAPGNGIDQGSAYYRVFKNNWQATIYLPAASVESLIRGVPVHTVSTQLTEEDPSPI